MASFIAKKVARKTAAGQLSGMEPVDPHYEVRGASRDGSCRPPRCKLTTSLAQTYVDNRGRTKSRKRKMPAGLSKRDERILVSRERASREP